MNQQTDRVCHFGSQSGTQKFNFRIKNPPKNLFYKILCLLFQQGNYAPLLIYQVKMASSLSQVAKNQLIMKYCSKLLDSSIFHNIFIAYIKKFTIVDILG